jgi:hypothetical protein
MVLQPDAKTFFKKTPAGLTLQAFFVASHSGFVKLKKSSKQG